MAGKGKKYWLEVWNGWRNNGEGYTNEDQWRASERLLKRYGYLWGTTYGKQVNYRFFSSGCLNFSNTARAYYDYPANNPDQVINVVNTLIANKPIKEDGDLHQIIKLIGEKVYNNEDYYLNQFKIEPRQSFFDSIMSLFCCFSAFSRNQNDENKPILKI